MRTYATALEAYFIDNNTYIHSICPDTSLSNSVSTWKWFSLLTTAIAYLTSISLDPFSKIEARSWGGGAGLNPYHLCTGNGLRWENTQAYINATREFYVILSLGPDLDYDMVEDQTHSDAFVLYDIAKTNFGGSSCYGMPYDASNGTRGGGDIYRFSGEVLPAFLGRTDPPWRW